MVDIDRRAMSRMAPDIKLVHMRLEAWGKWAKDRAPNGWAERTILGRLIDEGPGASHSTATVTEIPEAIAETDRAVAHLSGDELRVIKSYYMSWVPREILALRLRMRPKQMDRVLTRARWRLAGFFSAYNP